MDEKSINSVQTETLDLNKILRKKVEKLEAENLGLRNEIEARKLSQVGLREGQNFLQEILSSQGETFVLVFDENGVINFAWGSVKLEDKYQIKFSDYIGKYPSEFLKEFPESFKMGALQQVFSNGQVVRKELGIKLDSGSAWWDLSLSPVLDENKQVSAVVAAIRDISERKTAEILLKEKGFWKGEVIHHKKDGTHINILGSVSMFRNKNGDPTGAVAVLRDITKR